MRSGTSLVALAAIVLAGCDQIQELVAPPPPPERNALKELTIPVAPPKPAPPPTTDEIVAAFQASKPEQRTDAHVVQLCSAPDAPPRFRELHFGQSRLTDIGGKQLEKFHQLQSLVLAGTAVGNETLKAIESLPQLEQLDLSNTQVTDAGFASLLKLKTLRELRLDGCNIADSGFGRLGELPALEALSASKCRGISGVSFTAALLQQGFPQLRLLQVSGTRFGVAGMTSIGLLDTLEHLNVSDCGVTDEGMAGLAGAKSLAILFAAQGNFGPRGCAAIAKCRGLRELTLDSNQSIVDECFQSLKVLRNLEQLSINRTLCTDAAVQRLKTFLPKTVIQFNGRGS